MGVCVGAPFRRRSHLRNLQVEYARSGYGRQSCGGRSVLTGTPYSDGLPGLRITAMLREGFP